MAKRTMKLPVDPKERAKELDAKRDAIKKAAKKEGDFALYGPIPGPFYRQGVMHPKGSIVKLHLDEDPSVTWPPFTDGSEPAEASATQPSPSAPTPHKRPSDKSL